MNKSQRIKTITSGGHLVARSQVGGRITGATLIPPPNARFPEVDKISLTRHAIERAADRLGIGPDEMLEDIRRNFLPAKSAGAPAPWSVVGNHGKYLLSNDSEVVTVIQYKRK